MSNTSRLVKEAMDKVRRMDAEARPRRELQKKIEEVFSFLEAVFGPALGITLEGDNRKRINFLNRQQVFYRYESVNDRIPMVQDNLLAESFLTFALHNLHVATSELNKEKGGVLRKAEQAVDRIIRRIGNQPSQKWLESQAKSELHRILEKDGGAVRFWTAKVAKAIDNGVSEQRIATAQELLGTMDLLVQGYLFQQDVGTLEEDGPMEFVVNFLSLEMAMKARTPQVFYDRKRPFEDALCKQAVNLWRGKSARKNVRQKKEKTQLEAHLALVGIAGNVKKAFMATGKTMEDFADMSVEQIAELPGIGKASAEKFLIQD